ncbi:MAG: trypsin-like peptidase domain-containing protein [Pseudomonadota bacterium]
MAEHFLTKSRIDLARCIDVSGSAAVDQYDTLFAQLSAKSGPDVAKLFAEPLISKGNDQAAATVSWYSDRTGQGVPLSKLDPAGQSEVGARLTSRLEVLHSLIDDPEIGPLVSAALYIGATSDIWSVDGEPVLVNWGLTPSEGSDPTSRAAHYARTLGTHLPMEAAPPLSESDRATRQEARVAADAAVPPVASVAASAVTPQPIAPDAARPAEHASGEEIKTPPPPPRGRVPLLAWLPLVLLLGLFGGILVWLLMPGNRIFADDGAQPVVVDEAALRAAREVNRALELRLANLNEAMNGAVCRADGTLLMPDGLTMEGLLPPELGQGVQQGGQIVSADTTPTLPPAPERVRLQGQGDTATLLDHIDARTAMVLVGTAQGMSAGTGFFVASDLMVTNFHVIENATADNIFVTNKSLGELKRVEVLKTFGPMREVGADFALLRVTGVDQPFYTLRQSDASMRLQSVIAAGYPGDLLRTDAQFKALREGNIAAVPELTVTDGTVNTEQALSATTNAVVHSAPISKGNSGGPLIDMCGRVVGVNTFVVQGPLRNLNFALATDDLLAFLADTPAGADVSGQDCAPLVARPTAAPVASDR